MTRISSILFSLFWLLQLNVVGQGIIRNIPQTDGDVYTLSRFGDTVFVGGRFYNLYYPDSVANFGGIIDPNTAMPRYVGSSPNSTVLSSAGDRKGGFFIGGNFTKVGTENRTRLAHIDSNGMVTTRFSSNKVNGSVKAMTLFGDTLYVGGNFTRIGNLSENKASLIYNRGSDPLDNFPLFNGDVYCAVPDGNGGWYVGGNFTQVGGVTRNRLARIDYSGKLLSWNPNANGIVYSIQPIGGRVFVGGIFTQVGATSRQGLAAVDTSNGALVTWTPASSGTVVYSLAALGNTLYVGGSFATMSATARIGVAAYDASTLTLTSFVANISNGGNVNHLLVGGAKLFIGGTFSSINGTARNNLAAVNLTTGAVITTWSADANDYVSALAWLKGNLYVGGRFTTLKGLSRTYLAMADTNTGAVGSWTPSLNAEVTDMTVGPVDSNLYVVGSFSNYFAAYNILTGPSTLSWTLSADAPPLCISSVLSKTFVGGTFNTLGGNGRKGLAAFKASTGELLNWTNDLGSGSVEALMNIKDSFVYVGGSFNGIGPYSLSRFAVINRLGNLQYVSIAFDGDIYAFGFSGDSIAYIGGEFFNATNLTPWHPTSGTRSKICSINIRNFKVQANWNPNINDHVGAIFADTSVVYVGGRFNLIGSQSRPYAGAINRSNGIANSFTPVIGSGLDIFAIQRYGDRIIIGGNFWSGFSAGGMKSNLICYHRNTSAYMPLQTRPVQAVRTLQWSGNRLFCGGEFNVLGAMPRTHMAAIQASTGKILPLQVNLESSGNIGIYSIAQYNNLLFFSGTFTSVNDSARKDITGIDLNTGMVLPFNPNPTGSINPISAIYAGDSLLLVSGSFTSISGTTRTRFAVYNLPSLTLHPYNEAYSGYGSQIIKGPNNQILVGGVFSTIGGNASNSFAAYQMPGFTRITGTPTAGNAISRVLYDKNKLLVCGSFTTMGGNPRQFIAQLDPANNYSVMSYSASINNTVAGIALSNGNLLYASGVFTTLGGQARAGIGALNATTGAVDSRWTPEFTNTLPNTVNIRHLMQVGSTIWAGGSFDNVNGFPAKGLVGLSGGDTMLNISYVSASGNVCFQQPMKVVVNTGGVTMNAGNVFQLEAVDTSAPYAAPIILSTLTSTTSDTLRWVLPSLLFNGKGYRMQVRSSNPVLISKPSSEVLLPGNCIPNSGSTSLVFKNIANNAMTVSWKRGTGNGVLVLMRALSSVNANPTLNKSYMANSSFGLGDTVGNNNFVVYNGTADSVRVSNLLQGTVYHVAIIEYYLNGPTVLYQNNIILTGSTQTLPVGWLSFNGERHSSGAVNLNWATAWEQNTSHFEVERNHGEGYETIGKVNAAGNSNRILRYAFTDDAAPQQALLYRLRQVDLDGRFDFSPVVRINSQNENEEMPLVYPNPGNGILQIDFAEQLTGMEIYNLEGKLLLQKERSSTWATGLPPGMYLLKLNLLNGHQTVRICILP